MLPIEIIANMVVAVAFFIYWIAVFVIMYHLTRFGVGTQPKKFAAIFFLGSVTLFCAALIFYLKIDFVSLLNR